MKFADRLNNIDRLVRADNPGFLLAFVIKHSRHGVDVGLNSEGIWVLYTDDGGSVEAEDASLKRLLFAAASLFLHMK